MVLATSTIMGLLLSTGITASFLQPVAQKLADLLFSKIGEMTETVDKLRKLERALLKIQFLVDEVEDKHSTSNRCRLLIEEFKGALLDSEDLFDVIHLQLLSDAANDPATLELSIRREVSGMLEVVDTLLKELEVYFITEITKLRPPQIPHCSSFVDWTTVIGLEIQKGEMIKLLLAADINNNTNVISIAGMAGTGKSTLAQLVFNDPKVVGTFNKRMWWVCVSFQYDLFQITKSMLEAVTNEVCTLSNLDAIMRKLKTVMSKGKFLLVLDDMWNESPSDWGALKLLFSFGATGSRVLVTTRNTTVSSIVTTRGELGCISPTTLTEEQFWEIIKKKLKTEVEGRDDLKAIGLKLAEKWKCLPLAATMIGDALHLKSKEEEWDAMLKFDLWDKNQVYHVLKQSYDHLPAYLKRCFAYFSVYPRGQKIEAEALIRIWAAEGFIVAQGARRIQEIGREYLDELCSRSFIKIVSDQVEIHGFIHDLATLVSTNLCLCLEDTMSTTSPSFLSQNVRYLSLVCRSTNADVSGDKLKESYRYHKLRTFMLISGVNQLPTNLSILQIFKELFEKFKWLRVLNLTGIGIHRLNGSIEKLKYLRYLDLSATAIKSLPGGIVDLQALETLLLVNCVEFKSWPKNFDKLVKLRHLHFGRQGQMSSMPENLGKLTRLENLATFAVEGKAGYGIEELENMNCLRGSVSIKNLENVANPLKAQDAKLQDKEFLETLVLQWSKKAATEAEVLEHLKPHYRLKELQLKGYHGSTLPNWISMAPLSMPARQIKRFFLDSCPELVTLPSICHLTSLKELKIYDCQSLASLTVNGLPRSLEKLKISLTGILKQDCEEGGSEWETVKDIPEVEIDDQRIPTGPFPMP